MSKTYPRRYQQEGLTFFRINYNHCNQEKNYEKLHFDEYFELSLMIERV